VFQVDLEPFFVSRHEVTQAQWARLWRGSEALRNPSEWSAGSRYGSPRLSADEVLPPLTLDNPVENIDWNSAQQALEQYGLRLPTCAQWEHAGRAGGDHPWHTGAEPGSLQGMANVLDLFAQRAVPQWGKGEAWSDGHIMHSPVGSFPPNAFGLHDVHGNVFEWCLDSRPEELDVARRAGDGLIVTRSNAARYLRGGSHAFPALASRFGFQSANSPAFRDSKIGFRAARPLRPLDAPSYR
jgi:formylglycine-generating enzyme required for sulfatase activity